MKSRSGDNDFKENGKGVHDLSYAHYSFNKYFDVGVSCQLVYINANVNENLVNGYFMLLHSLTFKVDDYYAEDVLTGAAVHTMNIKQCYREYRVKFPISVNVLVDEKG